MKRNDEEAVVLVVDDEELFRRSAADAIAAACPGFRVLQAENGRRGLEIALAEEPDVVVTDIQMPELDGLGLLLALRENDFTGAAIVVTAYGDPRLETQVDRRGALGYVEKPVELPLLVEQVRKVAAGERASIEGITLAGFAQLLGMERKTCLLRVYPVDDGEPGDLSFQRGELVDARVGERVGDEAALVILGWDDGARLELRTGVPNRHLRVTEPLSHLLLEAMRLKDEGGIDPGDEDEGFGSEMATGWVPPAELVPDAAPEAAPPHRPAQATGDTDLTSALSVQGALAVALIDGVAGQCRQVAGRVEGLDVARAGIADAGLVEIKLSVVSKMGISDTVEDIVINLGRQVHLIRPLGGGSNLYLFMVLDRETANLGIARHRLAVLERALVG